MSYASFDVFFSAMRGAILIGLLSVPASADPCVASSVATVQGTTCDIGTLRFTFGRFESNSYYGYLTAADFTFNPVPTRYDGNGYDITGYTISLISPAPISVTAPPGNELIGGSLAMTYSITPLDRDLIRVGIDGGDLSVSGGYGFIKYYQQLINPPMSADCAASDTGNGCDVLSSVALRRNETSNGVDILLFFYGRDGATMRWDGTPTEFSFSTFSDLPEPASVVLLLSALVGVAAIRHRRGMGRHCQQARSYWERERWRNRVNCSCRPFDWE